MRIINYEYEFPSKMNCTFICFKYKYKITVVNNENRESRPVFGAKIMTPLGNTMNFINCKQCNSTFSCQPLEWLYKSAKVYIKLLSSLSRITSEARMCQP